MSDCVRLFSSYTLYYVPIDLKKMVKFHYCLRVAAISLHHKHCHLMTSLGLLQQFHKTHLAFLINFKNLFQNPHSRLGNTLYPQMVCLR